MPRKRTGTLVWTGSAYSARIAGGPLVPLHTDDLRVARARLRKLIASGEAPAGPVQTFEEAARRIVAELDADGMITAAERLSRLERFVIPTIGRMLVTEIRPSHVTSVLQETATKGLSRGTVVHVRNDIGKVFAELIRDEVLVNNPALAERVRTPKARVDKRRRALLTDAEFLMFVRATTTPEQLRVMSIVSRAFGGMRASDLHAFQYEDIDLLAWAHADVPRPKTEHIIGDDTPAPRERLAVPQGVAIVLQNWRARQGNPTRGPVFPPPPRRAKWRGKPSQGKRKVPSYARALRKALLEAGVDRHELHHPTATTKPVDFHSFRRAFVTAVGKSGLNAQTSMRLTGHRTMATHMRYNQPDVLTIPEGAVPQMGPADPEGDEFEKAIALFNPDLPVDGSADISEEFSMLALRPHRELNPSYRRERAASNLVSASNSSETGELARVIDLNEVVANCERLRRVASSSGLVGSKLSLQRAADTTLSVYLRSLADVAASRALLRVGPLVPR